MIVQNTKNQMVNFDEFEETRGNPPAQQSVTPPPETAPTQEASGEKDVPSPQGPVDVTADSRVQGVNTDKQTALDEVDKTYDGMIDGVDQKYKGLSDKVEQAADEQARLQQEQTDLTIKQIEQQKADAQKDYLKEQSAAYADWQKQSAQHGVNTEQMAAMGMTGTGYSETSQVRMYAAYQARVAAARESVNAAIVKYNNAMEEAKLQNSSALAEIALTALQQQMELALEGFQYKNQLILDKANQKAAVENTYYNRYLDILEQINTERTLAEEQRQFDATLKEEQRQFDESLKASEGDNPDDLFIKDDDEPDTSDYSVTNRTGSGWVVVGVGRMTWEELEAAIENGDILEVVDHEKGTITFKYA